MKKRTLNTKRPAVSNAHPKSISQEEGYPLYPVEDDIYNKFHEETDIDPEELSGKIGPNESDDLPRESLDAPLGGLSDGELDIPGSELDDNMENIGSEDEENNYYSLGGENHLDLEENQGE